MMYIIRTPNFVQSLLPGFVWRTDPEVPTIHLTFDDGPIPEVTPWIMEQLAQYNAQGTFFCVGENASKHPDIVRRLRDAGHQLGNHTHNHLSGWKTDNAEYLDNIRECARYIDSDLFRPPYGRMKPRQAQLIMRSYRIIMWDVLSGDFDGTISNQQCLDNIITNASSGSIVVMHDSLKAWDKLEYVLPRVLDHFNSRGYAFSPLPPGSAASESEVPVAMR